MTPNPALPDDPNRLNALLYPALDALAAKERDAVLLRFHEGLSFQNIASRLDISESAAQMRVSRALEKMNLFLSRRGIATTAAVIAATLPACAGTAVPQGLAAAISAKALAATAASTTTTSILVGTLLMKAKLLIIPIIIVLLGVAVWQQSNRSKNGPAAQNAASASSNTTQNTGATTLVSPATTSVAPVLTRAQMALQLAQMTDAKKRDAALAAWATQFKYNTDILAIIAELKAESGSTVELRGVIAPHLTRQWAAVAPKECIENFLKTAALTDNDPFDSGNNPFDDLDGESPRKGLFHIVAEAAPTALREWLGAAPKDLIAALMGSMESPTFQSWMSAAGTDEATMKKHLLRQFLPREIQFFDSDFGQVLKTVAPEMLLGPIQNGEKSVGMRYFDGFMEHFASDDAFAKALIATQKSPADLWPLLEKAGDMSADFDIGKLGTFTQLARLEMAASGHSLEQSVAAAAALEPGIRQAATYRAIFDSLSANPSNWDATLRSAAAIANAINAGNDAIATEENTVQRGFYDDVRGKFALLVADKDQSASFAWIGSIADDNLRARTLGDLVGRGFEKDVTLYTGYDWNGEHLNMSFEIPDPANPDPKAERIAIHWEMPMDWTLPVAQNYEIMRQAYLKKLAEARQPKPAGANR